AVATFVERKSRLTIVKRLHGRDSQSMTRAVLELASQLQDKLKTLTVDHGKEFANYQIIERQTGTRFILPMLIHHMNAVVMRTVTEFCDALFPRDKLLKS